MRRATWIFLAAILLPCLALAWLAIRSEQDQQVILEHQQAIIDQGVADSLAQNVRAQMDGVLADFVRTTQQLLATAGTPAALAAGFNHKLCAAWPPAQVGFAVDLRGTIYAPERSDGVPAQMFRKENESFLSNREDAEVYSNVQNQMENLVRNADALTASAQQTADQPISSLLPTSRNLAPSSAPAPLAMPAAASAPDSSATISASGSAANAKFALQSPTGSPLPVLSQEFAKQQERTKSVHAETAVPAPTESAAPAVSDLSDSLRAAEKKSAEAGAATASPADSDKIAAAASAMPASPKSLHDQQVVSAENNSSASLAQTSAGTPLPLSSSTPLQSFSQQAKSSLARIERQVAPQENTRAPDATLSNVLPAQSDFRQLIGQATSGSVARFLEDKLCLLVWSLPSAHDSIVFGAQLNQDELIDKLRTLLRPEAGRGGLDSFSGGHADYCLALLDDKGRPVALSQTGFTTDWKHPFVATEIGEVLPHWEAALYLTDPGQMSHSARVLHFTIGLIILLLVVAIIAGGTLIGADVGRQMRLAQQKTDFVSNVSHELKTPLTSIRMFADMLAEGRVEKGEKQATYLRIISAESARLTRLINNVLDFARLERGSPPGERHPCDLVEAARDVVETCLPHLESTAVALRLELEAESLPLLGDRDALSQIILNLVSNAEKYGGGEIIVRARRQDSSSGPLGCIDVLDRGPGVPPRQVEKIFAPFQRLDDSLASGVPGSGLGLTLARRMARAHGGDVTYQSRAGGGSCFTLSLPLFPKTS